MRDLIKKVLDEHSQTKSRITNLIEESEKKDWCDGVRSVLHPTYEFCRAAENYIKNSLTFVFSKGKTKRRKKVFMDFEKGLEKFFKNNEGDDEISKKLIRIEKTSPIYLEGEEEIKTAGELLKNNCKNYNEVTTTKLKEFEESVKLYFIENEMYSVENRLPTNYSALANLFTKFFELKGAFDGVVSRDHDWNMIAENWITHSFHPYRKFHDIRPDSEKHDKLSSLDFQELARIYFTNDVVFNSETIRKIVKDVLEGVRGMGFDSEDKFEKKYLENKVNYRRFAKDYGFVDMFAGIDFLYEMRDGTWIPVQVKSTATEPTYLISKLGCKKYVIAERSGDDGFNIEVHPKKEDLPY